MLGSTTVDFILFAQLRLWKVHHRAQFESLDAALCVSLRFFRGESSFGREKSERKARGKYVLLRGESCLSLREAMLATHVNHHRSGKAGVVIGWCWICIYSVVGPLRTHVCTPCAPCLLWLNGVLRIFLPSSLVFRVGFFVLFFSLRNGRGLNCVLPEEKSSQGDCCRHAGRPSIAPYCSVRNSAIHAFVSRISLSRHRFVCLPRGDCLR